MAEQQLAEWRMMTLDVVQQQDHRLAFLNVNALEAISEPLSVVRNWRPSAGMSQELFHMCHPAPIHPHLH